MAMSVATTHRLRVDFVVFLVFLSILLQGTLAHGYKSPVKNVRMGTVRHCPSGSILESSNHHVLQLLVVQICSCRFEIVKAWEVNTVIVIYILWVGI